jgi:thymidylate kinase
MRLVAQTLYQKLLPVFPDVVIRETHHPGSTPLGQHLRQLVKYPSSINPDIEIDDLSRQMLYMVDTVTFVKSVLIPSLANNEIVFADRSTFISALAYGTADGLSVDEILRIFSVITPPKADRVYILQCPWAIGKARICKERTNLDHYDKMNDDYHNRLEKIYDNLITHSAEMTIAVSTCVTIDNIQFVDTNTEQEKVVTEIVSDLMRLIAEREDIVF